jgi:hypothetical protein
VVLNEMRSTLGQPAFLPALLLENSLLSSGTQDELSHINIYQLTNVIYNNPLRPPPNMARRSMQFSSTNPFADAAAPEYDAPLSTFPTPIQPGRAGISSSSDFVQQHRQNSPPPPQITNKPPSPAPTAEGGQRKWPTVTQNYMYDCNLISQFQCNLPRLFFLRARTIDTGRGRSATVAAPSTQEPPPRPASNAPVYRGYNDKY